VKNQLTADVLRNLTNSAPGLALRVFAQCFGPTPKQKAFKTCEALSMAEGTSQLREY
jgi:hypothetical protein